MINARREAFSRCPETCDDVLRAITDAIQARLTDSDYLAEGVSLDAVVGELATYAFDAGKEAGTLKLRAALIDCEGERLELSVQLSDAEMEIDRLSRCIEDLEAELAAVRDERDALAAAQTG